MITDRSAPEKQTITRTVTITTVETWTITIGPGDARADIVSDQLAEETSSANGEEACRANQF
jgi:hypothetical protein